MQISQSAEDIILYILKCQMLVSTDSWHRIIEQLAPVLPLLHCHAGKSTPIGRATLAMLDPDIASTATLSSLQVTLNYLLKEIYITINLDNVSVQI